AESPFADVRQFVSQALLADDTPEHRRYRINADALPPAAVYRFCESAEEHARSLGMKLIRRSPRLRLPEELFRLTESPDRTVRGFVIGELWGLYRDRGVMPDWKPYIPPRPTLAPGERKPLELQPRGPGVPHRPEQPPAGPEGLSAFLRRMLFEIPPG